MPEASIGAPRAILVTGGSGQLGIELARARLAAGWEVVALDRADLDLRDVDAIAEVVAQRSWHCIINAAAYTAVDKAESDVAAAWRINALAPAVLGEACANAGIPLVQVSTDYVFNGHRSGAWEVDDPIGPLGVYGASKLGGELAVQTSGARAAIVRTAWVVSAHGHNFVKTMLRLAEAHDRLSIVDDQVGSPTSAADLAQALITIAARLAEDASAPTGTFHFSNAGVVSWAGFAAEVFRQSSERGGPVADITPVTTADYPTPARRPANSALSHRAINAAYGIEPRPWQVALSPILDELIGVAK